MKKIFYIALFVLFATLMVACGDDHTFKLNVQVEPVRNAIVVNYELSDPKAQLKNSELTSSIYLKDSDKVVSSKTLSYDKKTYKGSVTFSGLDSNTEYTIKFFAGYEGKKITLETVEVKTKLEGTKDKPYSIKNVEDFEKVVKNDPDGYFVLENDIDFQGASFDALFSSSQPFAGTFDGNNKVLSNFKYGTSEEPKSISTKYYGFFGYVSTEGVIKNLTFKDCEINVTRSSSSNFGFVAGYNTGVIENVKIENSKFKVAISGYTLDGYTVGGIAGANSSGGVIKDCSVGLDMVVSAKRNVVVGGICGTNSDDSNLKHKNEISGCAFSGLIDVDITNNLDSTTYTTVNYVGGIIGKNFRHISNCTASGTIDVFAGFTKPSTTTYKLSVGGLVGWNLSDNAKIIDSTCSFSMLVKSFDAVEVNVGLLAGENGGNTSPVYATLVAAYTSPLNSSLVIETFETTNVNAGLVGVERVYESDAPYTGTGSFTHNIYHNVEKDGTVEVELKETKTI